MLFRSMTEGVGGVVVETGGLVVSLFVTSGVVGSVVELLVIVV